MKKLLSLVIAASLCSSFAIPVHASNNYAVDYSSVEQAIVQNISDSEISMQSYFVDDVYVCVSQTAENAYEFAYNTGDTIVYKKIIDGVLVENSVSPIQATTLQATESQLVALDNILNNPDMTGLTKESALNQN